MNLNGAELIEQLRNLTDAVQSLHHNDFSIWPWMGFILGAARI